MQYEIAVGATTEKLEEVVNEMISEGWKPQGGLIAFLPDGERAAFGHNYANLSFAQAMVKAKK